MDQTQRRGQRAHVIGRGREALRDQEGRSAQGTETEDALVAIGWGGAARTPRVSLKAELPMAQTLGSPNLGQSREAPAPQDKSLTSVSL